MATNFGFEPVTTGKRYFVSYKTEDLPRVGPIARQLNAKGVPMWYDYGIEKGEKWNIDISNNIRECENVLLFATRRLFSANDTYVRKECRLANGYHKKIYVIWLDDIEFDDVSENLKDWFLDIDELQGVKVVNKTLDEITWTIINEFKLEYGRKPQPETPIYSETQFDEEERHHKARLKLEAEQRKHEEPQKQPIKSLRDKNKMLLSIAAVIVVITLVVIGVITSLINPSFYEYTIENGEVTITGLNNMDLEELTIPENIEGKPVTKSLIRILCKPPKRCKIKK